MAKYYYFNMFNNLFNFDFVTAPVLAGGVALLGYAGYKLASYYLSDSVIVFDNVSPPNGGQELTGLPSLSYKALDLATYISISISISKSVSVDRVSVSDGLGLGLGLTLCSSCSFCF